MADSSRACHSCLVPVGTKKYQAARGDGCAGRYKWGLGLTGLSAAVTSEGGAPCIKMK